MLYSPQWERKTLAVEPWRQRLLEAADEIERHGWCQNKGSDDLGRRCIISAIALGSNVAAGIAAVDHLRVFLGCDIIGYNDAPGRTKEEVISVLRACANQK